MKSKKYKHFLKIQKLHAIITQKALMPKPESYKLYFMFQTQKFLNGRNVYYEKNMHNGNASADTLYDMYSFSIPFQNEDRRY